MTEIDFYSLSRPLQDGLIDALGAQFTPAPILMRPGTRHSALLWGAVSEAAALALVALAAAGFGDVDNRLALHPTAAAVVYALLAVTCALGILQALAARARIKALPFAPGLFLFPACVIDARDHKLRVYPLAELASVSASRRGTITARWSGASFAFPIADAARSLEIVALIEAARDRMRTTLDAAERRRLDPFEPPAIVSPFAATTPLARVPSTWERRGGILAVTLGVALGVGLFSLRNLMSDHRMFALAQARDNVASYKSYASRGRRHVEEVTQTLLPRAELRLAIAQGSVEAIDAFLQAYPKTGIQAEVDAAHQSALLAEFERTRKLGTLASLLSFAARYPKHGLDKPFGDAKHDIYARALAHYKTEMPKGGEVYAELVGRILAYAERVGPKSTPAGLRGPAAQIRLRKLASQDLERAETLVKKSPMYGGVMSLPTHYITAAFLAPHEKRTAEGLAEGLARGFDPEILTVEPGPAIDGSNEEPVVVTAPTLVVNYRVESSGAAHARKKPPGIFLGLMFFFKGEFLLPSDPKPVSMKHTTMTRIPFDILKQQTNASPPGVVETLVYNAMMRDAFSEFQDRYLAKWYRPRPDAAH